MSNDDPSGDVSGSSKKYSETKNVFGVKLSKVKTVSEVLLAIAIPVTLVASISFILNPSLFSFLFAGGGMFAVPFLLYFRVSEKRANEFNEKLNEEYDGEFEEKYLGSDRHKPDAPKKSICRECHEPISPGAKRCSSCGWKPKKRGGLWWGATAVMSLNPIGWAMGAKGASDKYKSVKGVSKKVPREETDEPREQSEEQEHVDASPESDPLDTLERLKELKDQGVLTEEEFAEKKEELLSQI